MFTVLNLIISLSDILLLAILLSVVSLYTGSENRITLLIPASIRNAGSMFPILSLVVLFCIKNGSGYILFKKQSSFFFSISTRLARQKLFNYLNGSYQQYVGSERAKMLNSVNHYPIEFAQNILTSLQTVITESALIIITITAILLFKPMLFLLLVIFLLPPVVLAGLLIRKRINHIKNNIGHDAEKTSQYLNEAFSSFIESNIYDKKYFFTTRHLHFQKKLSAHVSELQIAQWIPNRLVEIFAVLGLFTLILCNKFLGYQSNLIDIGAFIAAAYKIMPGIVRVANASATLKTYGHVIANLGLEDVTVTHQPLKKPAGINAITFREVSFSYKNKEVLNGLSTTIQKGDFVCISGPSGSGKTSFIHLLLGFNVPESGAILFNDLEVSADEIKACYSFFSYGKQQPLLIQDTIQNNITLEEDFNKERLTFAVDFTSLNQALLHNLKDGLQTVIADEGKDISGGQRQRIALARTLYHNSDIIVLDEPFSELDRASEIILLERLRQFCLNGKIVILVSHNQLAMEYCNKHIDFGK